MWKTVAFPAARDGASKDRELCDGELALAVVVDVGVNIYLFKVGAEELGQAGRDHHAKVREQTQIHGYNSNVFVGVFNSMMFQFSSKSPQKKFYA